MASAAYGSLPFAEQIDFFRKKVDIPTDAWTDVYAAEHNHAFMVAGARGEVLTDMRAAVQRFIEEGRTLAEFRKDFDAIVARTGWAYNGGRNWRTRVIYETNLRQSYNAGREAQMADPALRRARPYGLYRHGGSAEPRQQHLAWDGIVLPLDDPWWDTHTPQNGWGCSCKKYSLSERDVQRMGLKVLDQAPPIEWEEKTVGIRGSNPRTVRVPKGIDPGFEYRPGAGRIDAMTPRPLPGGDLLPPVGGTSSDIPELPPARPAPASRLLPDDMSDQDYVDAFLAEFGLGAGERATVYFDVAGEPLLISDALFRERGGEIKAAKRGRERYLLLIADTIKNPDEIWEGWGDYGGKSVLRRRYVARWQVEGQDVPALGVFEVGPQGWVGVTAFSPDEMSYIEKRARRGKRVWTREK